MRILQSIRSLDPAIGGTIEALKQSSLALAARGHSVEVVSLDGASDPWVKNFPTLVHALGSISGTYGYAAQLTPWLKRQRSQYDAVIVNGLWQYQSFAVWRALRDSSTPYYVFPHGMLDPWFKRTYPLKHFKKLLYWPWAEYRVLRDAAAVLFTSEEERQLARESFALYRCHEKVVNFGIASPAVDLPSAREEFFARYPRLRGRRIVLFLGRLHEKKGCDLLIESFARTCCSRNDAQPLHLVMAGPPADDEYLRRLEQLATSAFGADDASVPITFSGMLTGNVKWGALAAADVFALPSHQENFGISVVEALASGVPVLISNCVNIWREIDADHAGFVEKDDVAGTTRLLERWLAAPDEERATMRKNAKECFLRRFEIDRATESLLAVLQPSDVTKATSQT